MKKICEDHGEHLIIWESSWRGSDKCPLCAAEERILEMETSIEELEKTVNDQEDVISECESLLMELNAARETRGNWTQEGF